MKFQKYNDIENSYRSKFVNQVRDLALDQGVWVATEKLHGANFSFWCDGNEVKVAKRSSFTDGSFFSCQEVIDRYEEAVLKAFEYIKADVDPQTTEIVICGELCGIKIQKEVKYMEEGRDFFAFDLKINGVFVDYFCMKYICKVFEIPTAPEIALTSFSQTLSLDPVFNSKIMGIQNNDAEGIVIKPAQPKFLPSGSRVIMKIKSPKFSEKKNSNSPKVEVVLSQNANDAFSRISDYITENRLKNVISKEGEIKQENFGKLNGLFIQDIYKDYQKDNEINLKDHFGGEWKPLHKKVSKEAALLIRENFINILDGEF